MKVWRVCRYRRRRRRRRHPMDLRQRESSRLARRTAEKQIKT